MTAMHPFVALLAGVSVGWTIGWIVACVVLGRRINPIPRR